MKSNQKSNPHAGTGKNRTAAAGNRQHFLFFLRCNFLIRKCKYKTVDLIFVGSKNNKNNHVLLCFQNDFWPARLYSNTTIMVHTTMLWHISPRSLQLIVQCKSFSAQLHVTFHICLQIYIQTIEIMQWMVSSKLSNWRRYEYKCKSLKDWSKRMKCEAVGDTNKLFAWISNLHGVGMVVYKKNPN